VNGDSGPATLPSCGTSATGSSHAGTYATSCSGASDTNYAITYETGTLTIAQATPNLGWQTPNPITYGDTLTGVQLDANANVPGSFAYSPSAGTALGAGTTTLKATFTPTDTIDYVGGGTASTQLTVNPAALAITAASPSTVYGQPIPTIVPIYAGLENGDAAPATPPSCETTASASSSVGTYDTSCNGASDPNYEISYVDGELTISQATPKLSWTAPDPISVGTPLDSTELDASSDVSGTFAYSPDVGTTFSEPGQYTLSATFTPDDLTDYSSGGQVSTTLTVTD
jgi:hypothetical protein